MGAGGGGDILIGAEQWPDCLNPVTECANSSWEFWTTNVPVLPGVFDTTADGNYEVDGRRDGGANGHTGLTAVSRV